MKHDAVRLRSAVQAITDQRRSQERQPRPNLVPPPRAHQIDLDGLPTGARMKVVTTPPSALAPNGVVALGRDSHLLGTAIATREVKDEVSLSSDPSLDDREVPLLDSTVAKLFLEDLAGVERLGDDEAATGASIQPVDEAGLRQMLGLGISLAEPSLDAGFSSGITLPANSVPTRRLVEHHELVVLEDDLRAHHASLVQIDFGMNRRVRLPGLHWASIR